MGYKSGKLFEVPIANTGKVVVTRLAERVYMIMWNSAPDNRLTTVCCPLLLFLSSSHNLMTDLSVSHSLSVMPYTQHWTSWRSSILTAL